jgi:peptide deformylase
MNRRDLLKFGLHSAMATAGVTGFLKIYKHGTGVGKIMKYPNPILRKISSPVSIIDDKILSLSDRMISTLRYHSLIGFFSEAFLGRGLAAPQVGVSKRLVVCGLYGKIDILINPQIVEKQGAYSGYESCLSLPEKDRKMIKRPGFIRIRYMGIDSKENELTATKDYAALLAHEIDHLNGILYIDHEHAGFHT